MSTYVQADLDNAIADLRKRAVIHCRLLRELAGGQPAGEKGLKAFVEHHLGLVPETEEFNEAVARIQKEEIGERDTTPESGEVKTEDVYQVNVIRRSKEGAWVAEHQIKALLKQAASRLELFTKKRGSKGDVAEMGTVRAFGESLQDGDRPWEIYLRNCNGPAKTHFTKLNGCVASPQGKKSIQHHTEMAEEESTFSFEFLWPAKRLTADDFVRVMAAATQIGLGSCLSLGFGRFEVVEMEVG